MDRRDDRGIPGEGCEEINHHRSFPFHSTRKRQYAFTYHLLVKRCLALACLLTPGFEEARLRWLVCAIKDAMIQDGIDLNR